MDDRLTIEERQILLRLARSALDGDVRGVPMPRLDLGNMTARLRAHGASFVTLTKHGELRGCIGALEATQALAADVCEHAVAAALEDPRFERVRPDELESLALEVSRLTAPRMLEYADPADLLKKLRRGVDGVILRDGIRRATFLPQVWDKLPDGAEFLDHLCAKMGASPDTWRNRHLDVLTYQVEEFHD